MQEFSSISVSSYEAGSLAERLTEQSRDGWQVVAIVPTGSTITAYLCRESDGAAAAPAASEPAEAAAVVAPAADVEPDIEPAAGEAAPMLAATAATMTPEPEPAVEPAVEPTVELAAEPAADTTPTDTVPAAAAGAAPAGWYADPSGRFELRYWDGGQWTEHVSRAGQQYTDPPVA